MTTTYKTYKWFNPRPCTITEGTAMYRDLASKHHPDHGGSVSDMQEINAEWDELKPTLPRFCSEQAKQGRQDGRRTRQVPGPEVRCCRLLDLGRQQPQVVAYPRKARFPLVCEPLQILLAPARRHQPPQPPRIL